MTLKVPPFFGVLATVGAAEEAGAEVDAGAGLTVADTGADAAGADAAADGAFVTGGEAGEDEAVVPEQAGNNKTSIISAVPRIDAGTDNLFLVTRISP
jgi:hypothetical protein